MTIRQVKKNNNMSPQSAWQQFEVLEPVYPFQQYEQ